MLPLSQKYVHKSSAKKVVLTSKIIIFILIGVIIWLLVIIVKFSPEIMKSNDNVAIQIKNSEPVSQHLKSTTQFETVTIASSKLIPEELSMFSTKAFTPRSLIPTSMSTFSPNDAVLIVGGTDGSGTRRVVQTLIQLGVKMVSEDAETFDIHADLVGGWPTIVHPLIQYSKRLDYDVDQLPEYLKLKMKSSLVRLLNQVESDSVKPESHKLGVGGAILPKPPTYSKLVKYGFKAPVSMVFTSYWADIIPNLKILHSLRDGRDIAFSVNQGPVDKFYTDIYSGTDLDIPLTHKSIKLWSDWNSQIYKYSLNRMEKSKQDKSMGRFDYLTIRSEDLVTDDLDLKFSTLSKLARFVGSSLSNDEVCCVAKQGMTFLGSHDRTDRDKAGGKDVQSRYGKWRKQDKHVVDDLNIFGEQGLRLFDYEPHTNANGLKVDFDCKSTTFTCQPLKKAGDADLSVDSFFDKGKCDIKLKTDFKSDDLRVVNVLERDSNQCCRECQADANCRYFTLNVQYGLCYLKSSVQMENAVTSYSTTNLVSGIVLSPR